MPSILDIIQELEQIAPPSLQESYDNSGLITGNASADCTGVVCTLDATEEVILEAAEKNCNMVVAHHPIIFRGLKSLTGRTYSEKAVITAIKNNIAIYAIHTNLDNVIAGVNGKLAHMLGLINVRTLMPKESTLRKLYTYVPIEQADKVRSALFNAGAGHIGRYSECSYNVEGYGTFKPGEGADPFVGERGEQHKEQEVKIETVYPRALEKKIVTALLENHPYEEPAFDIIDIFNTSTAYGAGIIGNLPEKTGSAEFITLVKLKLGLPFLRHSAMVSPVVQRVAICGGAGSFLINSALSAGADVFLTADLKYHEFFDAEGRMMLVDGGHFETEQFTIDLLYDILLEKFPNFAVLKTAVKTNPVFYS